MKLFLSDNFDYHGKKITQDCLFSLSSTSKLLNLLYDLRKTLNISQNHLRFLEQTFLNKNSCYPHYTTEKTRTGRFSSVNPNFQNIAQVNKKTLQTSVFSQVHRLIRASIQASDSDSFYFFDFDQQEMRIASILSKDPVMLAALNSSSKDKNISDLHTIICNYVNNYLKTSNVNFQIDRNQAKSINFGLMYGRGSASLAKQLHCSPEHALSISNHVKSIYKGFFD
jgi:DNA polymerase-1